jgi:E3 ubiquitin-protein ligase UHRF1
MRLERGHVSDTTGCFFKFICFRPFSPPFSSTTMSYAEEREQNIARNRKLLAGLDIGPLKPKYEPKENLKKKATAKKRRSPSLDNDGSEEPPKKISRAPDDSNASEGARRSSRLAGRTVDYKQEQDRGVPEPITINRSQKLKVGKVKSKRTYDPSVILCFSFQANC